MDADLKQIWPLGEAALSAECFLILQSPTQSHRGSRGIHLGFSRPGQPCRGSTPHPRRAPLCQAEVFPGRDPDLAPVHPGLGRSSSGTTTCPKAHSSHASALSLPCSGQSVWGILGTKKQQASFWFEACQPSTYAVDGTGLGAGSPTLILTILSVAGTFPRRIFPLCFRNWAASLAASLTKAKFIVALRNVSEN